MSDRPFAVFDIDGTIIRWQLYHAIADEMARKGLLDREEYRKVREARFEWKKRAHEGSFAEYEKALVNLMNETITSIKVEDLLKACKTVIEEYKDQVYTYTRDLIEELKGQNYLLFAISASQQEIVSLLASYYGFDDYGGSTYSVKDGYFSGGQEVLKSERKPLYLKKLVEKHGASWKGSIAVGDSESDIPMLSIVEKPIAFNPTRELFEHATQQGWDIVVERKNMVYKLSRENDEYGLTV